ncbi:hypothetical protein OG709_13020 [Streptomyces sp. NBC_01267]|uniref:hypothetical protein n=1 Tax=Streptomyces sp. NBC_01267 TaxID=2903805 RepID=UPI002E35B1EA|nr:hypothetical protein [Streptomyces sp. NBC_01267]
MHELRELPDVTVQRDGAGRELPGPPERACEDRACEGRAREDRAREDRAREDRAREGSTLADAADGPVFVDVSGRRSRKYRRIGWLVALGCACYAVLLLSTVVGGSSTAPWLSIPGPAAGKKADRVRIPAGPEVPRAPVAPAPVVGGGHVPVPAEGAYAGVPKARAAVSRGVAVGVGAARSKQLRVAAAPGRPVQPPSRVPGDGTEVPAGTPGPPTGGTAVPPPSAGPTPSDSATAPAPAQSDSAEGAP